MTESMDILRLLVTVLVLPAGLAIGKWAMHFWERERDRSIAVQDVAAARAEKAHDALVATLNLVVANCRDERTEALLMGQEQRNAFFKILDENMRQHDETSKEIVRAISDLRVDIRGSKE